MTFVVDISGSMNGTKIQQAKNALLYGIRTLKEGDLFNVIAFESTTDPFAIDLIEATDENKNDAVTFVENLTYLILLCSKSVLKKDHKTTIFCKVTCASFLLNCLTELFLRSQKNKITYFKKIINFNFLYS